MYYFLFISKRKVCKAAEDFMKERIFRRSSGIDGILVTVGLCIIALLLCVVMKDRLAAFIETIVTSLTNKATGILGGT